MCGEIDGCIWDVNIIQKRLLNIYFCTYIAHLIPRDVCNRMKIVWVYWKRYGNCNHVNYRLTKKAYIVKERKTTKVSIYTIFAHFQQFNWGSDPLGILIGCRSNRTVLSFTKLIGTLLEHKVLILTKRFWVELKKTYFRWLMESIKIEVDGSSFHRNPTRFKI